METPSKRSPSAAAMDANLSVAMDKLMAAMDRAVSMYREELPGESSEAMDAVVAKLHEGMKSVVGARVDLAWATTIIAKGVDQ